MRLAPAFLVLAAVFAHAHEVAAQAPDATQAESRIPAVDAGQAATLILRIPAPTDIDSASYSLALADGYRSFGPASARVGRLAGEFIIPISFATPDRLPAGRVVAGTVTVHVDGSEPTRRDLLIEIRERREVTFVLDAEEMTVAPDGVAGIPFRVHNRGNLPDTVFVDIRAGEGWKLVQPVRLVLEPGDSAAGALRIAAPVSVAPGERELILVSAGSVAGEQTRTLNMVVVSPEGWFGGLAQVPSSVFVGHAFGMGSGPVLALTGGGRIGPDTDIRLDLRHSDDGRLDPALQRQMAGPRLRATVRRGGLDVHAGDVYGFRTTVSGSSRQARGLRTSYDPAGPLAFRAIAARPTGFGGELEGGYVVHAEAELETRHGDIAVLAGDVVDPARGGGAETRSTGTGVRWAGGRGVHEGSIEATVVRFAADTARRTGPAVELGYRLTAPRVNGRFQLRRVPDAVASTGGRGNELSGSLSAEILPRLHLLSWGYRTEQNFLGNASGARSSAANVGVRNRLGPVQLQLGASNTTRVSSTPADTFDFSRNTVRAEASYTRGVLSLQSDAEVGTSRDLGREGGYHSAGASVRFYGADRSGWIRGQYSQRPGGIESTSVHAGGALDIGPAQISGGLSSTFTGPLTTTSFWSSTEIQARRNLSVHIGTSARPAGDAADWAFSLGVSRRLNLPLPVPRQPDLHGVVFDDANDNGVLDPGETGITGVTLALGYLTTTSDDDGSFAFRDATGPLLRVRTADLPRGYVLSPRLVLPTRGRAAVPLLRTATLYLELFLDRDEDGQRDLAESVAAGALVTLTDEHGRQRTATATEDGTIRLSGLLPGHYAITARPAASGAVRGKEPEVLMEVDLAPGAEVHHTLAVPLHRRTIRMGGETPTFPFDGRR